jgi:carbamoyltransferase
VPSAPHDAGVAIGCAFHGWRRLAMEAGVRVNVIAERADDRIGTACGRREAEDALDSWSHLLRDEGAVTPGEIAEMLVDGRIIARCEGRSEFGPRALGCRSLLGNPMLDATKDRLNKIKGRQPWRPVAPVVCQEDFQSYFSGPTDSPYMNMLHWVCGSSQHKLPALQHPDGSARVQTLSRTDDPFLYDLISEFGARTGVAVLANTSFNGKDEPIVETAYDAVEAFLAHDDMDFLLLGGNLVARIERPTLKIVGFAPDTIVTMIRPDAPIYVLLRQRRSMEVSAETYEALCAFPAALGAGTHPAHVENQIAMALRQGFLASVSADKAGANT